MALELPEAPESSNEGQRRLRGQRAGKPGEGFAETRIRSQEFVREIDPVLRKLEEIFGVRIRVVCSDPEEAPESLGQQFARLSKRRAEELGYADNPEQLLLHCPKCGLMNDFTIDGRQVYYLSSQFRGNRAPQGSTTHHRIRIIDILGDAVQCQCGKCGAKFLQRV